MNDATREQAREIYRTVRLLKSRMCRHFEERDREVEGAGNRFDVTFAQFNVLMVIEERGVVSLKELAEVLHVSPPSASAMVDRLVEMGMVIREQSPVDRREVRIRLSEGAMVHFQEMESQILEYLARLLGKLGPGYARQWCDVYGRVNEILQSEEPVKAIPAGVGEETG